MWNTHTAQQTGRASMHVLHPQDWPQSLNRISDKSFVKILPGISGCFKEQLQHNTSLSAFVMMFPVLMAFFMALHDISWLTQIISSFSTLYSYKFLCSFLTRTLSFLYLSPCFFLSPRILMWPTLAAAGVMAWLSVPSCTHIYQPTFRIRSSSVKIR